MSPVDEPSCKDAARDAGAGRRGRGVTRALKIAWMPTLLVLALWLIHRELGDYRLSDIVHAIAAIRVRRVVLAVLTTGAAYLSLTGYDWLAFRYIRHPLPYHRIATAAFIGYAMSNTIGNSVITGASIRFRLYSAWGLSVADITKVVVVVILTFWLGVCVVGGAVLLVEPDVIASLLRLPRGWVRPLGVVLLGVVAAYLAWNAISKRPLKVRRLVFPAPPPWLSVAQITVTVLDLALAGTVLHVLLAPVSGLSYPATLGIYLVAVIAGLVSQVPGGLGVFETVFLHLLPPTVSPTAAMGVLLAYRGVYYLLPLGLALILMAGHEIHMGRRRIADIARAVTRGLGGGGRAG